MEKNRQRGRFQGRDAPGRQAGRWLMVTVLLVWDGLLLYMIGSGLIEPVYGGGFVALVSIYLGYQL